LILIYVHDETICGVSATLRDPKRYKQPIRITHMSVLIITMNHVVHSQNQED